MRSIPPRHRSAVARRIAAGLPLWAAARGSAIPAEDVSTLMGEDSFRQLIAAWTDIFELDDQARERRLLTLASMIIEERLEKRCWRTAHFVQHRCARRQKPREVLAKGFAQLVDMERARVERLGQVGEAVSPPTPSPTPVHAAVAEAEAARRLRAKPDPVDAASWRQAGTLRRQMLGEQVLFAAAAPKPVEEIIARQAEPAPTPEPRPEPKLNRAQRRRLEKVRRNKPGKPAAKPAAPAPAEESDAAFRARAWKSFEATFANAPPQMRAAIGRMTQEQKEALAYGCWPRGEETEAIPWKV